ncbi:hypothetical protein HPB47_013910 [Ixodes persulcatus]|uniref:Uncharacterized protein n=1 Tax=Ixodes persulcatus TaxID=34615 RepID=A0AC60QXB7_IXOPE|nr:hypothetical protein HPB47_013910 [Ixodes persulcatus]
MTARGPERDRCLSPGSPRRPRPKGTRSKPRHWRSNDRNPEDEPGSGRQIAAALSKHQEP